MFKKKEATRLGEILVSKGLITPEQLAIATHEQTKRNRLLNVTDSKAPKGVMIGEILVEFGFIDQLDLKRGLNWQQRLRHVSIAMALCAPFMVFAPTSASAQTTSSSSSSSSQTAQSVTIQAENYDSMLGVLNQATDDVGGGKNIYNFNTGDWMSFSNSAISVPATGTYTITYRVAATNGASSFVLKEISDDSTLDTVTVPNTGGWQTWVDVKRTVTLTKGIHSFKLVSLGGNINMNWFRIDNVSPASAAAASPSSETSYSSSPSTQNAQSVTIQAENYASMLGVLNQATDDVGGGQNIYNFNTGDWMSFSNSAISVPATGTYTITYRVAATNGASSFVLKEISDDSTLDTVTVPNTGGWQTWVDVKRIVTLTKGIHSFKLVSLGGNINMNWFRIDNVSLASAVSSSSSSASGGLPLTIQTENYASMTGVWNQTTDDVGGGQNVVNVTPNDWMSYTNTPVNIPETGSYKFTYRIATTNGSSSFQLKEASSDATLDTVALPNTGGWQTWVDVTRTVTLTKGVHTFKLLSLAGNFNINWFRIEAAPASAQTSSASSAVKSSTASSNAVSSAASSVKSSTANVSTSSTPSTSTTSSASSSPNQVAGPVALSWVAPVQRENGTTLDITELGGYEIRYKKESDSDYTYVTIKDAWTDKYSFNWLEGSYVFQIAAFDKNGNYSSFADIQPK